MPKSDSSDRGTKDSQSESSLGTDNQESSQPEYLTVEHFKSLFKQGLEEYRRSEQSAKDKAIKQTNERVESLEGNLKQILQQAAKEGKSASDVVSEMKEAEASFNNQLILDMARAFKEGKFPQPASQGSGSDGEVDMTEVIEDFGLDIEDRRVAALATQRFETIEAAERAAIALLKKINKTSAPSESERPVREGDAGRPTPKLEQLRAQYDEEIKNVRGVKAVMNVKLKYRKLGLPIS